MSMPADALDDQGRAAITKFYGDVFGWMEYDMLTQDRRRLVMRVHSDEQFVFLIADDSPMAAPRMDHFGMSVGTLDEFEDAVREGAGQGGGRSGGRRRPQRTSTSTRATSSSTTSTSATSSR